MLFDRVFNLCLIVALFKERSVSPRYNSFKSLKIETPVKTPITLCMSRGNLCMKGTRLVLNFSPHSQSVQHEVLSPERFTVRPSGSVASPTA